MEEGDGALESDTCQTVHRMNNEKCLLRRTSSSYNPTRMSTFIHSSDPLSVSDWSSLQRTVSAVGNATIVRKFVQATEPMGAGTQTLPLDRLIGITEGYRGAAESPKIRIEASPITGEIVPIIFKDFVIHWRDLAEARARCQPLSMAKAAAAASICARSEELLAFYGSEAAGSRGLMNVEGRNVMNGLRWEKPGESFENFKAIRELLSSKGLTGPFAAVVHPEIYAAMHRVLVPSSVLEITHVSDLLGGGVYQSALLAPGTGVAVSTGGQNLELAVSVDTSAAFLGATKMNLPFRVFKAISLRILRVEAICTFHR